MKLSVAILTYNQEKYIRQCLDSVLMQKVGLEYEIVVGDDASSDGTQDVLQEYAAKCSGKFVLLLSERNEGISKNYKKVLSACKGEYIALCEGDDFWTDAHKLQTQVNFLEKHPGYGFVGTYNTLLFPDGTVKDDPYDYFPEPVREGDWELYGDVFEYAKYGPVTRTVSLCFRKKLIEDYIQYVGMGNDMVLQTILAKH
jgi:glycosyltransferase involved in cell wall biosynthesis